MFQNKNLIRFLSGFALALFIVVMILSIVAISLGLSVAGGLISGTSDFIAATSPNDPGAGWLVIGSIFGTMAGSFVGGLLAAFGFGGAIADLIIYIPALIGQLVWKKTGNVIVYWVCMSIWFLLICGCIVLFHFG